MTVESAAEAVECGGVRCTATSLVEIDRQRVVVSVQRAVARRVTLQHGFQAPSPVLQIVLGAALAGVGYWPLRHTIRWFRYGGTFVSAEAGLLAFAFVGAWLMVSALRRGYFISVDTDQGRKRLFLRGAIPPGELEAFRLGVERLWGMNVRMG
jgi:hypothetical protein